MLFTALINLPPIFNVHVKSRWWLWILTQLSLHSRLQITVPCNGTSLGINFTYILLMIHTWLVDAKMVKLTLLSGLLGFRHTLVNKTNSQKLTNALKKTSERPHTFQVSCHQTNRSCRKAPFQQLFFKAVSKRRPPYATDNSRKHGPQTTSRFQATCLYGWHDCSIYEGSRLSMLI